MEATKKISKSILVVAIATVLLLLIPLVAMQFTDEVKWGPLDFMIMGALLFGTGLSYVVITRNSSSVLYRIAAGITIATTLLMIWANLAVGLIGEGPNPGNLLYIGVLGVTITGTMIAYFTGKGMARTMFSTALSLVLLAGIALAADMQHYPHSSTAGIIGVNAFFAGLYTLAGLLFRYAAAKVHGADSTKM